ncbi:MAG: phosphate acetyltransferase [Bacteroidales bacterium]|jgi:phosphate acetyltransferase|nr:phosphate acetyltransferase [Bacteroidales bacterium]
MDFIQNIILNAKKYQKHIVLPEGLEERTLRAADHVTANGIARITLLGEPENIRRKAASLGLKHIEGVDIIPPGHHPQKAAYVNLMLELRKAKGLTQQEAEKLIENPLYLGAMMIKAGHADGEVAGAMNATGDVLRPAFQYVKTQPGTTIVSGVFFMILKDKEYGNDGILVFADCAVHPNPTDRELAEIAMTTARTTRVLGGFEPKIAMLSFSTKGSARHEMADKVIRATQIVKETDPQLAIDGELQADAALVPAVGAGKAPGSPIAGQANVLIFPSLDAGNIGYKLVQRLAHAEAIGPVLQGMAAPINDLSRGCSVDDIVKMIAITANQAAHS